ncbi:myotrophin-like [Haliotis asinina]|uniref:myotrophin-like n=1 Tax=Haliotis asinina TaxID=109174 RepID=UPI003531F16F
MLKAVKLQGTPEEQPPRGGCWVTPMALHHSSKTDANEDLTPRKTVPPTPVATQDSDHQVVPSKETGRDLYSASEDGDLERVKQILAAGHVDVNTRGWGDLTPVMVAARWRHRDVVEFLVGRGANVSLVDKNGYNILHWACYKGDLETVKLVLSMNVVDINTKNNYGETAVYLARIQRYERLVDLLVSRGAH